MRTFAILIVAVVGGLAVGAGLSWRDGLHHPASAPIKKAQQLGHKFVAEAAPVAESIADRAWRATASAQSSRVTIHKGNRPQAFASNDGGSRIYYRGCSEVREAGKAPLYYGQPGYRSGMDGDGDGIACEDYGPSRF